MASTQKEAPHSPKTATIMATLERITTQITQMQIQMERFQTTTEVVSMR